MPQTRGLRHLCQVMRMEISTEHFRHLNDEVPHFHGTIGSWDTFPIRVFCSRGRYQPKHKNAVAKFQGITTHMGLFAYVSGPHPGQMSDTTLAQKWLPHAVGRTMFNIANLFARTLYCHRP